MAEVLGVVASGIAVTQLADQIVRSARNLHTFWRDVKDAPRNIGDTLEELELLGCTLQESQEHLAQDGNIPPGGDSTTSRCLAYCQKTADELESIVTKLQPNPDTKASRRLWIGIRGAFMKREIQDIQSRLDRAKQMLSLAVACYSLALQSQLKNSMTLLQVNLTTNEPPKPPSKTHQNTVTLTPGAIGSRRTFLRGARRSTNTYKSWWLPGFFQLETIVSPTRRQDGDQESVEECDTITQWRLVPASWLRPRQSFFEFGGNGWKYSFKLARTVPLGSEVFEACWRGDVERIIELFGSGSATINDVLPDGKTLLHYAACAQKPHMCVWLIAQGVDCTAVDEKQLTPLHILAKWPSDIEATLNCARILVEKGQIDPLSRNDTGWTCLDYWYSHTSVFEYLVYSQQHFSVDYSQISNETLLQSIGTSLNAYAPLIIRRLIGNREISFQIATEFWFSRFFDGLASFLVGAALRLSYNFDIYGIVVAELDFISELMKSGADVNFQAIHGLTPWDLLVGFNDPRLDVNKECLIFSWLSCLHKVGINLAEYFKNEEALHGRGKLRPFVFHRKSIIRVFTVYYGERDDDISVLVEDIWENEESHLCPGAWDEELEHAEARGFRVLEGHEPSAFWSVTTSGFQDGDYSAVRASCDPELPKRQRQEAKRPRALPDHEYLY